MNEPQMIQALVDTAPPLNTETLDRLRRILAAPSRATTTPRAIRVRPHVGQRQAA